MATISSAPPFHLFDHRPRNTAVPATDRGLDGRPRWNPRPSFLLSLAGGRRRPPRLRPLVLRCASGDGPEINPSFSSASSPARFMYRTNPDNLLYFNASLWRTRKFTVLLMFTKRSLNKLIVLAYEGLTEPQDVRTSTNNLNSGDDSISLFVRMLGLDNDSLDREQAVVTLWKYSQGGKRCVDTIMQFPGCIFLVTSLLKSDSCLASEAAAGLLNSISTVSLYRDLVAESGTIEEISSLLCQSSLAPEVKEQCLCTLWNLSTGEKLRLRIAESFLLPKLVKFLDDDEIKVKEAAGGILANLAFSHDVHNIMIEAGVIPKLAGLLKSTHEDYKILRKEAKTALLELAKDEYQRILIIEEGLVRVPVIGAAAYKAFKPPVQSWPSLPDGTEIQRNSVPSRYGASELLLGLNIHEKNLNLDEAKVKAIVGRSQQQFLARIGAIEMDDSKKPNLEPSSDQYTLLPWIDGVARLVLILGLEDDSAILKAAYAVADASISEQMRVSFKEAGALGRLIQLLSHDSGAVCEAAAQALDKLSISHTVRKTIEKENILDQLVSILKDQSTSQFLLEKAVNIVSRICDPGSYSKAQAAFESEKAKMESSFEVCGIHVEAQDNSSRAEIRTREVIIDSDLISRLTEVLRSSSPSLQIKVAHILEYLAILVPQLVIVNASNIELGLDAVSRKALMYGLETDFDNQSERNAAEAEEAAMAVAAVSRLLAKLLGYEQFCDAINARNITSLLLEILKSSVPLHTKDWVAACLVKLQSRADSTTNLGLLLDMEVALYDTIPRLVEQMKESSSHELRESAVIELNQIISRGVIEYSRAVAAAGGIFSLVKLIEEGSGDAVDASLAILYNLSMDIENHPAILAAGAVPSLKRIVLSEGANWTRALHLLRTLPT